MSDPDSPTEFSDQDATAVPELSSDQSPDSGRRGLVTRVLERFPEASRRPLLCESAYNVGNGAYYSLNLLVPVVLETILNGTVLHLAVFWSVAHGSSVLSPLVGFAARFVPCLLYTSDAADQ